MAEEEKNYIIAVKNPQTGKFELEAIGEAVILTGPENIKFTVEEVLSRRSVGAKDILIYQAKPVTLKVRTTHQISVEAE